MDLERLSVRLRQRSDWETIDLGLTLVRTWWRPVYKIWLTLMLPLSLGLIALLGGWGLLLFWWLMPLGQIAVLMILSQRVFGQETPFKSALRGLPPLWRRGLPEFAIRRFVPGRSMRLAVGQLEGLRGDGYQARVRILSSQGQETPGGLPIIILAFESVLFLSMIVLILWMQPVWIGIDMQEVADRFVEGEAPWLVGFIVWSLLAISLLVLDPFYIGIGFALYLNRRTQLEGWDLEIALRRLARRVEPLLGRMDDRARIPQEPNTKTPVPEEPLPEASAETDGGQASTTSLAGMISACALGLLVMAWVSMGPPVWAQESAAAEESIGEEPAMEEYPPTPRVESGWSGDPSGDPRRVVDQILLRPEFQREKRVRWRLREDLFEGFEDREREEKNYSWLQSLAGFLAMILEPLIWMGAILLLLFIAVAAWRQLPEDAPERREDRAPETILGLDVKPESLPGDVAGEAERLWREGQATAALSLLYRGALTRLVQEGIELRESFTENDCLHVARERLSASRIDFLTDLTRTWQSLAYAHRVPDADRARRLWTSWPEHFGRAS